MSTNLTRKAIRVLRDEGFSRLAAITLHASTAPLLSFGCIVFFLRELDGRWRPAALPPGLQVRRGVLADLPRLVSAGRPDPDTADLFRKRFHRGDWCFVVTDAAGDVVRSSWVSTMPTHIPEIQMEIVPRAREAYLYDAYTRPHMRRRGIDAPARCFVFDTLRAAGFERAYSYVPRHNLPGVRAATRWQTAVAEVSFVQVRGFHPWVLRARGCTLRTLARRRAFELRPVPSVHS